ncbi:MAG: tetracycline resistance MFS efflux pump [Bacteroidetes bacterium RIFOXYA12_FULL_33_9]|nr:MAG: tetracycline resistance MFS efflux pump [Bacteroidetes bacterium RIFOXYA12_FULL_33_9]
MNNRFNARLGFIFVTVLIDVIGVGIIIPVIPSLIEKLTNTGIAEAAKYGGWLMFSYAIMQFIFAPVLGSLSDKVGRRPVLLLSLFGLGINYLIHAFAPSIFWLFIARIFAGVCGASVTTATAYIADVSEPHKKAQNFGLIGSAFGLGFIIGPVMGGVLSKWGVSVPFFVAAGLAFLNVLYGYFVLPESLPTENRRAFVWKRANPIGSLFHLRKYPVVSGIILAIFMLHIAGHAIQSSWTFYTMFKFNWNETMVGYSLGLVGLLVAIVQGVLIRYTIPRLGVKKSIFFGMAFWGIGMTLFAFATEGWMMFAFLIPYCLGGIAGPAMQGVISNEIPSNEQGELQGAITSLISLTSIIGPLLMTNLFSFFSKENDIIYFPGAPFMLGTILIVLSFLFSRKSISRLK